MKELWPILLQYVVPAVLGLVAGVVGSLFGPLVQWAVEKRRVRMDYRREVIQAWRKKIDKHFHSGTYYKDISIFVSTYEYSAMKQHLTPETRQWIERSEVELLGAQSESIPAWVAEVRDARRRLLDEVARIEQKWGLV